jgi:hypothetical protein
MLNMHIKKFKASWLSNECSESKIRREEEEEKKGRSRRDSTRHENAMLPKFTPSNTVQDV